MKKVMVVDDNEDIVETIKMILKKEGYETASASSGNEMLNTITNIQPDLVLLDIMMPGLTTREILEALKTRKIQIKIIFCTVVRFSEEEKNTLLKEFGIVDYITKPFDITNLVERIKKQIGK